jgi:hypothetical protein
VLWCYAMSRPAPCLLRRLSLSLALLIVAASADLALGQGASAFRITHTITPGAGGPTAVTGRVFNDSRGDAIDVYVTAEALDAAGKVVASGVSYVGGVPAGSSSTFAVKVPSARAAITFRVLVTSYRFGFAVQS